MAEQNEQKTLFNQKQLSDNGKSLSQTNADKYLKNSNTAKYIFILLTQDTNKEALLEFQQFFKTHYKKELQLELLESKKIYQEPNTLYFLYMDDEAIKNFLKTHKEETLNIAILPNETCKETLLHYGISKDIYEAAEDALNEKLRITDQLLLCNGEIVFQKISIGNVQNLSKNVFQTSLYDNIKEFFYNLKNLRYQAIALQTAKEQKIQTVASGVLVLEDYTTFNTLKTMGSTSFHDGKLNALIIAPKSLVSYIYYLAAIFFYHKFSWGNLPKNIGFVSTSKLIIEGSMSFDFTIDDVALSAKTIELEVFNTNLTVGYGKSFESAIAQAEEGNLSETVNINHLPKGEMRELLVSGKVPFLKKASDEDIKEALLTIKESAKISSIFIALMILSTLLATVGIFQDSTPTVIGAMILAPLMAPIISLSMGIVRSNKLITQSSIITLALGVMSALFFSFALTFFMPLDIMTSQMSSRINPNLLDLFVAIFSGIAGAYASSKEEVAKSLAGVAIAIALVPPLAVTGIGIGWAEWPMIHGSFLLFLTNLFGMIIAASLTFIILGYAPVQRAKKGLVMPAVLLIGVSIPLVFSFYSLMLQSSDYAKLNKIKELYIKEQKIELNVLTIHSSTKEKAVIECEVSANSHLNQEAYQTLQKELSKRLKKKVVLHVIPKIVVE
ncbi:MAG: TIGR00341 family protein [Sulfurovum sp.]|nr:TIGR00341 family protein [Sulfurovum sp.]